MNVRASVIAPAVGLVLLSAVSPADAQSLKYLGRHPGEPRGVIEQNGQQHEVVPGTQVPGWGQIQDMTDEQLVIDHYLTDDEKGQLRAQGAEIYDVSRVRVPREDLKVRR
jgi:hypothetical protein